MAKRGRPRIIEYKCKECGKPISRTQAYRSKLCPDCAMARIRENARQLQEKSGPYYERWKARYEAGMRRYLKEQAND
jgi:DNA-directed RNA polymerase subunit RPC12/RpoP